MTVCGLISSVSIRHQWIQGNFLFLSDAKTSEWCFNFDSIVKQNSKLKLFFNLFMWKLVFSCFLHAFNIWWKYTFYLSELQPFLCMLSRALFVICIFIVNKYESNMICRNRKWFCMSEGLFSLNVGGGRQQKPEAVYSTRCIYVERGVKGV